MDYLLRLFIPTIYALFWIAFPLRYMAIATSIMYIHIYPSTTNGFRFVKIT